MRPTYIDRYHAMLAGRGMKVGDQVVCEYRSPTPHQWWIHPWHVGVIEEVSDEAGAWNGTNSEACYCLISHSAKVRYLGNCDTPGFTQHDRLASLQPLLGDPVEESPWFGGFAEEAIRLYAFACRVGMGDKYAQESQKAWFRLNARMEMVDA
jgi:hypothetical protein